MDISVLLFLFSIVVVSILLIVLLFLRAKRINSPLLRLFVYSIICGIFFSPSIGGSEGGLFLLPASAVFIFSLFSDFSEAFFLGVLPIVCTSFLIYILLVIIYVIRRKINT